MLQINTREVGRIPNAFMSHYLEVDGNRYKILGYHPRSTRHLAISEKDWKIMKSRDGRQIHVAAAQAKLRSRGEYDMELDEYPAMLLNWTEIEKAKIIRE